ncbi:MAG: class I SAM-dependent methyltransferase [Nostoc sp. ChiSLP02]|nr:class I SAM-dependent methyltransferase [Nostoc sp. DedSLP05]MDZ8098674.1 class I SAM-dependent methyltransferase [Nostoc sp. DedSLP01]MDZ8183713.1 class I SAM-dependent methyltransferase [Nostoc sp. ChiSLP02]
MTELSDELIQIWLQDGQRISERYSELVLKEGISSAKSLGEREAERNFQFFEKLFEGVVIEPNDSVLDIGCGKGELLDYLTLQLLDINNLNYLGIDIVPAFLSAAKQRFPLKTFENYNFIHPSFVPEKQFDIVLALGVLVTRVREYNLFFEYFVRKMVKCARKYVVFNIISEIEVTSGNYSQPNAVGHSTVLSAEILESIINSLDCKDWRKQHYKIFPDATDMFVCIQLQ